MLKQPAGIVKMTNVAFIKYKVNNKAFEIACYRNKAVNWRNGLENDIREVLQSDEIYENANHGVVAKKADLNKYFANKTKLQIIEIILDRGDLQVTDKERDSQILNIQTDIANIINEKCVHPVTARHFTLESIKAAMKDIHYPVKLDQPAKRQALDCIKLLQKRYKISRAAMKIRLTYPKEEQSKIQKQLEEMDVEKIESEDVKDKEIVKVLLIEPSKYREINTLCKKVEGTSVEVLMNAVVNTEIKELGDQNCALELLDEFKKERADEEEGVEEKPVVSEAKKQQKEKGEKMLSCTYCKDAEFSTKEDHRIHFKESWHIDNVKRKTKNLPSLNLEEWRIANFNANYK